MIAESAFPFVLLALLFIWWRLKDVEYQAGKDADYFEWWMRSMENRKQDKDVYELEDE
jgi:hypothetical protein